MTKARNVANASAVLSSAITNTLTSATGDIIYASAPNTPAHLLIGTAGQVLAVNSGATAPEWVTASSGGAGAAFSEFLLIGA